jgi:polysaccharide pyruvyl transferase WcaK-like protein
MTIKDFITVTDLNLQENKYKNISYLYINPQLHDAFHKKNTYTMLAGYSPVMLLKHIFASKNILVGGGGIWGLDANPKVFVMSCIIFLSKLILRKKVYLIGIGYYNSTNRWGRAGAYLVGKAANTIIARDQETYQNFSRISKHTYLDKDIAFMLQDVSENAYMTETQDVQQKIKLDTYDVIITPRRFSEAETIKNYDVVADVVKNSNLKFLILLLEPKELNMQNYKLFTELTKTQKNITMTEFKANPVALYFALKKAEKKPLIISPQFHFQLIAYFADTPFAPLVYDNKVSQLHSIMHIDKKDTFDMRTNSKQALLSYIKNYIEQNK